MTPSHPSSLRLGIAQIHNHYDYDLNYQSIRRSIEIFADKNVDLVIFPECATTGYNRGLLKIDGNKLLAMVGQIQGLAKKHSINIALPTPWPTESGKYFNSVLVINSEGQIAQRFDKIGFQNGEDKLFVRGSPHSRILKLKGHKIAFIICFEMEQDPWANLNRNENFDLVLWPGFYASDIGKTWDQELSDAELKTKKNIMELSSPIVRVTCASSPESAHWPDKRFGGSLIFDKNAANVFTAQLENEDRITVDIAEKAIVAVSTL